MGPLHLGSAFVLWPGQMCGCAVSPQKISLYLRQKRSSFVEPGRVQLYEFLDLLETCEPREKFSILEERVPSTDKTGRGLYQMDDIRTLMLTPDEKLARHLNRRFQHVDSWMLPQDTTETSLPLSRKCQPTESRNGTRPPPPQNRMESSDEGVTDEAWTLLTPVPQLRCICYTPRKEKPILSDQDIQTTKNNIEELLYEMETLGERSRWNLNWKLDYYLPGYRERSSSRHLRDPQPPKSVKKNCCKDDVFKRLSAPRKRGLNSPNKRYAVWKEINQTRAELVCLQEVKLASDRHPVFQHKNFPYMYKSLSTLE
ncbi:uncharacterized protein [Dendrobates tinctorius]|uniref:uncharacterized protein isoform X2 n=1 Tax=Dendrobates tinctorius TaxID=92724 RepID=UPI003CC92F35